MYNKLISKYIKVHDDQNDMLNAKIEPLDRSKDQATSSFNDKNAFLKIMVEFLLL